MNAACKQWWQDHSDELTEWNWDSFRRVWEVAQLSVVAPSVSHNRQITKPAACEKCDYDYASIVCSMCGTWIINKRRQAS